MKLLITTEELKNLKSRALIPLECGYCHKTFHLGKNQVLAGINGNDKNRGSFCSRQCSGLAYNERSNTIIKCKSCDKEKEIYTKDVKEFNFCSRKCSAVYYNNLRRKPKPLKQLRFKFHQENEQGSKQKVIKYVKYLDLNCSFCHKSIQRTETDFSKSKSKTFFCCKSCKTKYANQHQIVRKPKSRAEILLVKLIRDNFPNLEVQENVRNILQSKLEIDIFIPSLKLAIELNGPVHYIPMYGQEKLEKVKNKDLLKQAEINQLGFNLIIIDISQLNSRKSTDNFITEYFNKYICPILS